jgi:DNA-binding CsgD family transcriptional regulator
MESARPGLIVLDPSLNVMGCNDEAVQVLMFPAAAEKLHQRPGLLKERVRSCLNGHSGNGSGAPHEFRSGKRMYLCRSFPLSMLHKNAHASPAHVLVLERRTNNTITMSEACERFGFTGRERETIQLLLEGLTSKEMAQCMKISPNTVKSFLRLVMVKMGVSTRAAIVGKVLRPVEDPSRVYPRSLQVRSSNGGEVWLRK